MNQRKLIVVLLVVVAALVGIAVWFAAQPEPTVEKARDVVDGVAVGTAGTKADPKKRVAKPAEHAKWIRLGPGTVVGVVREYGSERPVEGVDVSLEAGLPGPNELLRTKTRADGGFTFEKVTNFDAWTFRAKAPSPLSDAELAGVDVVANKQNNLGTVYLAPAFGVPGIVVDEKDTPIAGAVVRAIRSRPPGGAMDVLRLIRELPVRPAAVDTATSTDTGKFELHKVPPGRYDFTIEKAGYQLKVELGSIITPETKSRPLKFVLVRGFQADGKVVREGGGLVAGLPIVAFAEPGGNRADFSALDKVLTTTDENGAFHLDGLGGGRYVVGVSPEGEPSVIAPNVTIPTKTLIEITLKGDAWLEGKITADGEKPVADAQVYALNFDNKSPTIGNVKTDAAGHYEIRGLRSGPLQLFLVQAEGFGNYPEDLSGLMRGKGASDVKLVAGRNEKSVSLGKGGIIRGFVKEKDSGAPVAGARVEMGSILAMFGGSRGATTDVEGKFEITSVPKGAAMLMVSKEGWYQPGVNQMSVMAMLGSRMQGGGAPGKDTGKGATVVVSEAGEVIERTLELAHGSTLSGTVVTPDGVAVAGAQVSLVMEGGMRGMEMLASLFPSPEPRLTDAQGGFEIPGPAPGEKARVVARSSGYLDGKSDIMSCAAGDAKAGVIVKLRQGATLSGKVHDEQGKPIDGALVRWLALGDDTNEWSVSWRLRRATPTMTDAKGEFVIPNVETGKLAVEVTSSRHLPWTSKDAVAEDGKKSEFDVLLKLGAVIDGRVLGADGGPASGATVTFTFRGDAGPQAARFQDGSNNVAADSTGAFHAEGLLPGKYELEAKSQGAAPSEPLTVESGGPMVALQLTPAFAISGIVRAKGGGLVAEAQVALQKRVSVPNPNGGGMTEQTRDLQSVRTNAAGEFEMKDVPGGTYDLNVTAGWGASPRPNIVPTLVKDVPAGRANLVIEAEAGLTISGVVLGEDGQPAASGWVWAQPDDPKGRSDTANGQVEDGKFELTGLQPGKYKIRVGSSAGQQKTVVVEAGAKDVRVEFGGGGSVRIHVANPDGSAAAGARVSANGEHGGGDGMTDSEGNCEIKNLGEGSYAVYARLNSAGVNLSVNQDAVQVRVGAPTDVQLRLEKRQ